MLLRLVRVGISRVALLIVAAIVAVSFTMSMAPDTAEAKKRQVKVTQQSAKAAKAARTAKLRQTRSTRAANARNTAPADDFRSPRYASIVVDVNTGKILGQKDPDGLRHPASVTKVMTLYLLFEQIKAGRMTMDTRMPVSAFAAAQAPSKLGLRAGQTLRVEDAIKALITRSANDAAVVVAEAIGGTEARFAQMMTRKARQLGMTRTVYANASGLPNPRQVTTARDLAKLGVAIQDRFPTFYRYFSTRSFVYQGRGIANHNKLLGRVEGVDGIKTGYTRASGFNLLTSVKRDGRQVVAVVLGGRTGASRDATMRKLIADNLPRAYAGARQTRMIAEAPAADIAPDTAASVAVAAAEAPVAQPAKAERARPAVVAEAPKAVANEPAAKPIRLASADIATVSMPRPRPSEIGAPAVEAAEPTGPAMRWVTGPAPLTAPAAKPARTAEVAAVSPETTASIPVRTVSFKVDTQTGVVADPVQPVAAQSGDETASITAGTEVAAAEPTASEAPAAEPAAARSGWIIQIGATDSEGAARKLLDKARSTGHRAIASAEPFTETVEKNGATLWRARFAGFDDQKGAKAACAALKSKSFSCMPVRL